MGKMIIVVVYNDNVLTKRQIKQDMTWTRALGTHCVLHVCQYEKCNLVA